MNISSVVWGLLAVASGIFICAYGYTLFRTVLAGAGLLAGVWIGSRLTVGQDELIRLLVTLLLGGGLAFALYSLFSAGLIVAGAMAGTIIGVILADVLGVPQGTGTLAVVVVLAVLGAGLARIIGELTIIAGTSLLGGYSVLFGLSILFPGQLSTNPDSAYITMSEFNIALLTVIVLLSIFSQLDSRRLRGVRTFA